MLTLVVQAGGESQRMGRDKALVSFLGQALVERVVQRLAHLAAEVVVTTNKPEEYTFLSLPLFADRQPGRGALGGLFTALSAASQPLVAVVACDMPFASPALLQAESKILTSNKAGPLDAVIPRTPGGTEPFHAVYRRETCLPLVEAALQKDLWRVDAWFGQANIYFMAPKEVQIYDPRGLAFQNVNTPEELAQAEALARELEK